MPVSLQIRRTLGLSVAALAASIFLAFWLNSKKDSKKTKKKAVVFCEPDKVKEEPSLQVQQPVAMEVLIATGDQEVEVSPLKADPSSVCSDDAVTDEAEDHPASRSWADLMDEEEEELERQHLENSFSNILPKSQPKQVPTDSRKSNSDSGVVSPAENIEDQQQVQQEQVEKEKPKQPKLKPDSSKKSSNGKAASTSANSNNKDVKFCSSLPSCGSSDSGQGSEAGDGIRYTYHFHVPPELTGKLIGSHGSNIDYLRKYAHCEISVLRPFEYEAALNATYCNDVLKFTRPFIHKNLLFMHQDLPPKSSDEVQVCVIEGSRQAIDRCLELIREMFPPEDYPQFNLEQINRPRTIPFGSSPESVPMEHQTQQQLVLALNMLHEVSVSAVVSAGHIFVQQPSHPSFLSLSRLDVCMNNVYSKNPAPALSAEEITVGLVCVAFAEEKWYRVQVISFDAVTNTCDVKFLDFGGFSTIEVKDLRKIRSDFLKLPFQAIECYLANIVPIDSCEWSLEAGYMLQQLVTQENQILTCRMLGVSEDYVPMVHLYATDTDDTTRLLNRELVIAGGAAWVEHVAGVLTEEVEVVA